MSVENEEKNAVIEELTESEGMQSWKEELLDLWGKVNVVLAPVKSRPRTDSGYPTVDILLALAALTHVDGGFHDCDWSYVCRVEQFYREAGAKADEWLSEYADGFEGEYHPMISEYEFWEEEIQFIGQVERWWQTLGNEVPKFRSDEFERMFKEWHQHNPPGAGFRRSTVVPAKGKVSND